MKRHWIALAVMTVVLSAVSTASLPGDDTRDGSQNLDRLVRRFNRLVAAHEFAGARKVADRAAKRFPQAAATQLMARHCELLNQQSPVEQARPAATAQSSPSPAPQRLVTRTYPVADLVIPTPQAKLPPAPQPSPTPWNTDTAQPDFQSLIDLITATIAPDTWTKQGGSCSIQAYETTLSLVIRHTTEGHESIGDLLEQMRRLQDVQVTYEMRFIEFPASLFERLGIDFDFVDPHDAPAGAPPVLQQTTYAAPEMMNKLEKGIELTDIEAKFFLQAIQGTSRGNILFAPKVTLFNGQKAEINMGTPPGTPGAFGISLQGVILADNDRVRTSISVRESAHEPPKSMHKTVANGRSVAIALGRHIVEARNDSGVPMLKKVPYVSRMFKNTGVARETFCRYLLLTPRIVQASETAAPVPVLIPDPKPTQAVWPAPVAN